MSGIGAQALIDAVTSVALQSGRFDRVNNHEPKMPPGSGISGAVWVQEVKPVQSSGLASTSVLFVLHLRLYTNMLQEPQDAIDPAMVDAADDLMSRFSGGFTLSGLVREIDLLGETGTALSAQAGYVQMNQTLYRIITITLPLIVNDAWNQGA